MTQEKQENQTGLPNGDGLRDQAVATLVALQGFLETQADAKSRENSWRLLKWAFISLCAVGSVLAYVLFYARLLGFQNDPTSDAVARVQIHGTIAPTARASAERIVPLIERACRAKHVAALLLDINSGGGAPSEAERMIAALNECRRTDEGRTPKPVYALINGTGASAAYMLAMHADAVYAGRYSLVGSIGAIIRYNDLSELANAHGIRERAFRSAPLKGGPSLISGATPDDEALFQELVSDMGHQFLEEVKKARGSKLKIDDETLFSGRIWTAQEALEYGLLDDIAVLEDLKRDQFGEMPVYNYRQKSSFAEGMGMEALVRAVLPDLLGLRVE